jgi:hypothetical protein
MRVLSVVFACTLAGIAIALGTSADHLTVGDRVVFTLNLFGAVGAMLVNSHEAIRSGPFKALAPLRAAIGLIAAMYAVGYALVLTGTVPIAPWSQFFRGVSLPVWWVVWSGPVMIERHLWAKAKRDAQQQIEETAHVHLAMTGAVRKHRGGSGTL